MPFDISKLGLSEEQESAVTKEFDKYNEGISRVNSELKTEKAAIADKLSIANEKIAAHADLEKSNEKLALRIKELEENGKLDEDELTAKITTKITASMSEKFEAAEAQNQALIEENNTVKGLADQSQYALEHQVRDGGISSAMLLLKANPQAERAAKILARETVQVVGDDGKPVLKPVIDVDTQGGVIFRSFEDGKVQSDEKGEYNFQNWLQYLHDKEHLTIFEEAKGSNSRGGKMKKEGYFKSTMTKSEKDEYKEQHGYAGYNALPFQPPKESE